MDEADEPCEKLCSYCGSFRIAMKATVIEATREPMALIGIAAGTCYGKPWPSHDRVRRCIANGHTSVLEHASATFRIEGVSRACLAQLTRHRIASYSVESQRYREVGRGDWYVTPPALEGDELEAYRAAMEAAMAAYEDALAHGVRKEDARYLLPMATRTTLVMTINARSLQNFLSLRLAPAAQWEIRGLAAMMDGALKAQDDEWRELLEMMEEARADD